MPRSCVKNVYSLGMNSVQLHALYTRAVHNIAARVHKAGELPERFTQVFQSAFHTQYFAFFPGSGELSALSTVPIISNHELRKERNY